MTTKLHKKLSPDGYSYYRAFRVFLPPDPEHEDFEVGMKFMIVSVNRTTGEVCFSLDMEFSPPQD